MPLRASTAPPLPSLSQLQDRDEGGSWSPASDLEEVKRNWKWRPQDMDDDGCQDDRVGPCGCKWGHNFTTPVDRWDKIPHPTCPHVLGRYLLDFDGDLDDQGEVPFCIVWESKQDGVTQGADTKGTGIT